MLSILFAEIGTKFVSEMELPPPEAQTEDQCAGWPGGLSGAEELLDQPDDELMEHSGIQKEERVEPPSGSPDKAEAAVAATVPSPQLVRSSDKHQSTARATPLPNSSSVDNRIDSVGGKYVAIKNYREENLACPDLMGGHDYGRLFYGSFRNPNDHRAELTSESSDIVTMCNMSSTFDTQTFRCNVCPSKHSVLSGGFAAGAGGRDDRRVLVLSDQNFPAALPVSDSGKRCLAILRIEFASLSELTETFLLLAKSAHFSTGGVIVISSACHLARVGTVTYCRDLVQSTSRLLSFLGTGSFVAPGPFFLGGGTNDLGLIQSIAETYQWLGEQPASEPGIFLLKESYQIGLEHLKNSGFSVTGNLPIRLSLPISLSTIRSASWTSRVGTGTISHLEPQSIEDESFIIASVVSSLNSRLALNICQSPLLDRGPGLKTVIESNPDQILLVGASHSRHLSAYFDMVGVPVTCVSIPGWRATVGKAEAMKKLVEEAVAGIPPDCKYKTVAIFQLLDNTVYMTRTEEGGLMPCRKEAGSNKYHVDGEVMLAPKELLKNSINICTPIIRAVGDIAKIILVPLPRYTRSGCCEDAEHATNSANPDYTKQLLYDLDSMRRQIKDMCFAANLRNLTVVNLGKMLEADDRCWGPDPVHLKADGYGLITSRLIDEAKKLLSISKKLQGKQKLSALERNRKREASQTPDGYSKRARLHNPQGIGGYTSRGRGYTWPPFNRGHSYSRPRGGQFSSRGRPHHRGRGLGRGWGGGGHF